MNPHAVIFIDHHEAQILFPDAVNFEGPHTVHHRVDKTKDGHRHSLTPADLELLVSKVRDTEEILIAGPGTAKLEFKNFLDEHHKGVSARVVDVIAVDHPTSGELKNIARAKFKRIDSMR